MFTFPEIQGAVQAAKAIYEIVKANKALADLDGLNAAVGELNAKLVDATAATLTSQEKQAALSNRVRELEKELMEFKNWDREAERYQLAELCAGVFCFAVKPGMENGEPPHKICAACFNKRQKGYLQRTEFDGRGTRYKCGECGSEILDHSKTMTYPDIDPEYPDYF